MHYDNLSIYMYTWFHDALHTDKNIHHSHHTTGGEGRESQEMGLC